MLLDGTPFKQALKTTKEGEIEVRMRKFKDKPVDWLILRWPTAVAQL